MVDHKIVTAESGDVGALVRLCSALFLEDVETRGPFTDMDWPKAHARNPFLSLISRDDALCLLARSGRTTVGYLAGYAGERPRSGR